MRRADVQCLNAGGVPGKLRLNYDRHAPTQQHPLLAAEASLMLMSRNQVFAVDVENGGKTFKLVEKSSYAPRENPVGG